ncbi:MAG TPA: hypothetical protein VFU47_00265, partial [Armatimonadota bacterium]|nr:hypothetical protein [Armatimonadota bacterium]
MLRRGRHIAIAAVLLLGGALPMAWAARQTQGRVRKIKACVAIIPTMGEPPPFGTPPPPFVGAPPDPDGRDTVRSPDPSPYVFQYLDQRKDLKPDGWEFQNPAAPAFVTVQQAARWTGITAGQPLRADMAAYWEVPLSSANFDALAQMDVIYLPIGRNTSGINFNGTPYVTNFTENQRRILARLADAGVTIWLDWGIQGPTQSNVLGGAEGAS